MAAQGERELGDIVMGEGLLDPMAQEEEVEQEMLVVEGEQFIPPQMDPEPEMGAAAAGAAVHDTSPPPPSLPKPSPDPCRNGSPGYTRHGPNIRHAGSDECEHGSKHKGNKKTTQTE